MTVQELIEQLQKLDPNKTVYLGDQELDKDTYYYKALIAVEKTIEDTDLVVITYRK
jgi:hypothetical protein